MINLEYKLQILKENYKNSGSDLTLKEYVEMEAEFDPNFFRWLFDEDFDNDFNSSLSADQKEEYQNFLNNL